MASEHNLLFSTQQPISEDFDNFKCSKSEEDDEPSQNSNESTECEYDIPSGQLDIKKEESSLKNKRAEKVRRKQCDT